MRTTQRSIKSRSKCNLLFKSRVAVASFNKHGIGIKVGYLRETAVGKPRPVDATQFWCLDSSSGIRQIT